MVLKKAKVPKKTGRKKVNKERDEARETERREKAQADWIPKTELGKKVQAEEIATFEEAVKSGLPLLEPQIIDKLFPQLREKLVDFEKTTRVTRQGRSFSFRASVVVGDNNGHIGIGVAKDRERFPAIRKATDAAKLRILPVKRGCGSWECMCRTSHSVPFKVRGKCASVSIELLPAPKGVGLVVGHHIREVVQMAGVTDVWSRSSGSTGTKLNFVRAVIDALHNTYNVKMSDDMKEKMGKEQ
ncbi:MAG: 30S ribosomal protein S5 [Candidatus Diapherotrites archaeon]